MYVLCGGSFFLVQQHFVSTSSIFYNMLNPSPFILHHCGYYQYTIKFVMTLSNILQVIVIISIQNVILEDSNSLGTISIDPVF